MTRLKNRSATKPARDWNLIKLQYRTGSRSIRHLAAEHGITHVAIIKRAKTEGWVRDLVGPVQRLAATKVAEATARGDAATVSNPVTTGPVTAADQERERHQEQPMIDAEAELKCHVYLRHRKDAAAARELFEALLAEVTAQTARLGEFEELGRLLEESGANGRRAIDKLNAIYRRVISTPARVESAKKLSEMLATVIRLEREAFGIGAEDREKDALDSILDGIAKKRGLTGR